jgi:hypothetical protein
MSTAKPFPVPARRRSRDSTRAPRAHLESTATIAAALSAGLAIGVLTSFGQGWLGGPATALVNSASAWLVLPFAAGAVAGDRRTAAVAGLLGCLAQLVGYDVCSQARGYPVDLSLDAFWGLAAVTGGPLFGLAGRCWRSGRPAVRGLGPATLASAFVAEGTWTYLARLHETGTAILWLVIGGTIVLAGLRGVREWRWLALTLPLAFLAELVLSAIRL